MTEPTDSRRLVLIGLFAVWVLCFGYAFVAAALAERPGGGSIWTGRARAYLGWQGLAGMAALAVFAVGRNWPKGDSVRRLSRLPIGLALVHVALIVGVILWARGA